MVDFGLCLNCYIRASFLTLRVGSGIEVVWTLFRAFWNIFWFWFLEETVFRSKLIISLSDANIFVLIGENFVFLCLGPSYVERFWVFLRRLKPPCCIPWSKKCPFFKRKFVCSLFDSLRRRMLGIPTVVNLFIVIKSSCLVSRLRLLYSS